jgi:hypothetical protein
MAERSISAHARGGEMGVESLTAMNLGGCGQVARIGKVVDLGFLIFRHKETKR